MILTVISYHSTCNQYNLSLYADFDLSVEETVGGTSYAIDRTVSTSITGYAETILKSKDESFSKSDKVLLYYILNYTNEAAKYFNEV